MSSDLQDIHNRFKWKGRGYAIGTPDLLWKCYVGDLQGMKKACWEVFHHSVSTDDKPQHQYCPNGADSWYIMHRGYASCGTDIIRVKYQHTQHQHA